MKKKEKEWKEKKGEGKEEGKGWCDGRGSEGEETGRRGGKEKT